MSELLRDLRFGLRLLAKSPVFAATSVLLLAVGIGANTLIFSVVNALLLQPLPVSHPENLVRLVEASFPGANGGRCGRGSGRVGSRDGGGSGDMAGRAHRSGTGTSRRIGKDSCPISGLRVPVWERWPVASSRT
jgi:hypothetical protein